MALKYRPRRFDELVGQAVNVRLIQNAVRGGIKQQAYVFAGAWGSGKTSMARLFGCAGNCKDEHAPCGVCPTCQMIVSQGRSVNYREVDGASYGSVDSIRALQKFARGQPLPGNWQFVVIDEAHRVSRAGFDACLKIIEQPPPRTIFVFVTTEVTSLPNTIRSRCVELRFRRVPADKVKARLHEIVTKEDLDVTDDVLDLIVDLNQGILRDSILMLQRLLLTYADEAAGTDELVKMLGLPAGLDTSFVQCMMSGDREALNDLLTEAENQGTDYGWLLRYMIRNLRFAWLHKHAGVSCPKFYEGIPPNVGLVMTRDLIETSIQLGRSEFAFYAFAIGCYRVMGHLRGKP